MTYTVTPPDIHSHITWRTDSGAPCFSTTDLSREKINWRKVLKAPDVGPRTYDLDSRHVLSINAVIPHIPKALDPVPHEA